MVGAFTSRSPKSCMDVQVSEFKGQTSMNICNINFSAAGKLINTEKEEEYQKNALQNIWS